MSTTPISVNLPLTAAVAAQVSKALAAGTPVSLVLSPPAAVVTPPVNPTPPPPPPTGSNGGITAGVFLLGKLLWQGDWDAGDAPKLIYNYDMAGVNGPGPVIEMPSWKWFYWLPYPPQNFAGPATNGTNWPISADGKNLTHFTIALKPTQAGGLMTMQFDVANGGATDIPFGQSLTITQAKYGPAAPVPNEWNVYTIPLADFCTPAQPTFPAWIYKFINQQQGVTPQTWYIDQVGFF
jgi:hypothetical protein